MQHMAQYVYDFYLEKVKVIKDKVQVSVVFQFYLFFIFVIDLMQCFFDQDSKKEWSAPGEGVNQKGAQKSVAQHPGVDHESDSDEGEPSEVNAEKPPKAKKPKKKKAEDSETIEFQVTEIQNEIEEMETTQQCFPV